MRKPASLRQSLLELFGLLITDRGESFLAKTGHKCGNGLGRRSLGGK
jgi:hypothetical protein